MKKPDNSTSPIHLQPLYPDKIWVQVEITINIGNYENVKIQMGQTQTLGSEDNPDHVRDELCNKLLKALEKKKEKILNE